MKIGEKRELEQLWWEREHGARHINPESEYADMLELDDFLGSLPPPTRRLLKLYYVEGYTQEEIARRGKLRSRRENGRSITRSAVAKRLAQVRAKLPRTHITGE